PGECKRTLPATDTAMMPLQPPRRGTIIEQGSIPFLLLVGLLLMRQLHPVWHTQWTAAGLCALLLMLAGCGPAPAPAPEPAPSAANATPTVPAGQTEPSPSPANGDKSMTKWCGNIPYDDIHDQPLVVHAVRNNLHTSISSPSPAH